MPQVKYRHQGEQIQFDIDATKLRLGGFWFMASGRTVTRTQFRQLQVDNPDVEFVHEGSGEPEDSVRVTTPDR